MFLPLCTLVNQIHSKSSGMCILSTYCHTPTSLNKETSLFSDGAARKPLRQLIKGGESLTEENETIVSEEEARISAGSQSVPIGSKKTEITDALNALKRRKIK